MPFDWMRAIEKNRDDLIEIVTTLFLLAGIRSFRSVVFLPRGVRIHILALLRPAEFAVRRLIVMAACQLEYTLRLAGKREGRPPSSVILGLDPKTSEAPSSPARTKDDGAGAASRPIAGPTPRTAIPAFALFDPFKPFGHPWLEPGDDDAEADWPELFLPPDELVGARAVCRRILALEAALQDLDGQALRLARWRARRHLETTRPRRWQPMRPGLPPGWRKRPRTPAEEVLKECHGLALYAWNGPDTS